MSWLKILELLSEWFPFLATLLVAVIVIATAYRALLKRRAPTSASAVPGQLIIAMVAGIFVVWLILELPIDNEPRGQLLGLLGILVTAAVALSSTTLLGNAMAGFMLRSIRNFRAGDFIVVGEHRGRVSELGLLRTEIQTERRNLTTLPNLYLVSNPVTVVRSSGTFISCTVSLGYDVPRDRVERCLTEAAENAGLTEPFVFVLELGDFSITYQAAGFLEEVKYLISAESKLRACVLDSLHGEGIEIVSPTFMNQRRIEPGQVFVPLTRAPEDAATLDVDEPRPEERMFDKADQAESEAKTEDRLKAVTEAIDKLKKDRPADGDAEAVEARLQELNDERTRLATEVEAREREKRETSPEEKTEDAPER